MNEGPVGHSLKSELSLRMKVNLSHLTNLIRQLVKGSKSEETMIKSAREFASAESSTKSSEQ
eukprot:Awhi_evm1s5047